MNDKNVDYRQFERDRVISISDLMEDILRKIWLIIVLAVAFAVLCAGYKYRSDLSKAEKTTDTVTYEKNLASLSDEEIGEINSVLLLYDEVAKMDQYLNESIRMQIDPYHEDRVWLQYAVETSGSSLADVMQILDTYISGGSLAADLQEFYPDMDSSYLSELITFEEGSLSLDLSGTESVVSPSSIFCIRVIHTDEDSCWELANAVQECLNIYVDQMSESFEEFEISLLSESAVQVYDSSLSSSQISAVSDQISRQNKITTQRGYMSDEQIDVLDAALEGQVSLVSDEIISVNDSNSEVVTESSAETQTTTAKAKVHISRRYTLLGVVIGIVVGIIVIFLWYIGRGTLNVAQEMQSEFGITVFGQVHMKKQKNPLVGWWRRVTSKKKALPLETEQQIALTNLKNFCKNNEVNQILIAGTSVDLSDNDWIPKVQAELTDAQIQTDIAGGLPDSPEAIELMNSYPCVALVETLHTSVYKDVVREVELCMEQDVQVAGAILLG